MKTQKEKDEILFKKREMKTQKEKDEILFKKLWGYSPSLAESLRKGKETHR